MSAEAKSKRVKRVVTTDEVAHLWAHQTQDSARTPDTSNAEPSPYCWAHGQSFYQGIRHRFEGPDLFSYRARIGRLMAGADGRTVAVITLRNYSVTTNRHIQNATWACRNVHPIVRVPEWVNDTPEANRHEWEVYLSTFEASFAEAKNKRSAAKRFDAWRSELHTANQFCQAFGLEPFPVPQDGQAETVLAQMRAERERRQQATAEANRKAEAKRLRLAKRQLKQWLAGENVRPPYGLTHHHMRVEGEELVTTLGARVPVEHVRRAAPAILASISSGREWWAHGDGMHPVRFGHYRLDGIDANGTVHVGCHRFERAEIERVAQLIDTTD